MAIVSHVLTFVLSSLPFLGKPSTGCVKLCQVERELGGKRSAVNFTVHVSLYYLSKYDIIVSMLESYGPKDLTQSMKLTFGAHECAM